AAWQDHAVDRHTRQHPCRDGRRTSAASFCCGARVPDNLAGPTKESKMGTPSPELNRLAGSSVAGAPIAVTLLSLLAATAGAATARELFISQPEISVTDPASQQPDRGKPADHANPPQRGAPEATAS